MRALELAMSMAGATGNADMQKLWKRLYGGSES
jgi:hypothetical protein